jgi:tetratricopeptide (TPR) repeat protein
MADWTAPKTRFRFVSAWDEILYLTDKIGYWLYSHRPDRRRALHFVPRLRRLLVTTAGVDDALPGAEGWIRVHEAEGDLERAIAVMLKRCRMYQKYISIEGSPSFGRYDELADEYDWVGLTYDQIGNYVEAISWLERAQRLRRMYGVDIDPDIEEILDDARANLRRQQESYGFMVETNSEESAPDEG